MPVNLQRKEVDKARDRISRYASEGILTKKNAQFILDMTEEMSATGFSLNRQLKYIVALSVLSRKYGKDFDQVTKQDLLKLAGWIRESYNGETPRDYLVILRRFIRWIRIQEGKTFLKNEFPPEVAWIEPGNKTFKKKLPNELLSEEDIIKLLEHTLNNRDKAFIATLYESGARIGELLPLKIKDVEFDKFGARITLPMEGKTGSRKIPVIACAPALSAWLNDHPRRTDKNAPLFCGIWSKKKGLPVDYRTIYNMLQDTFRRAGIDKPCNPHQFRHSRATRLALELTEAQLCYYMGWVIGSKEARTYVSLSGRDTENAILQMYGLTKKEDHISKLKPVTCPRCHAVNDASANFCSRCSLGLDLQAVMDYDKQSNVTLENINDLEKFIKVLGPLVGQVDKIEEIKKKLLGN